MGTFQAKGSFRKTKNFLEKAENTDFRSILDRYGMKGLVALREYTPKDTGKTADSWSYNTLRTGCRLDLLDQQQHQ